MPALVLVDLNTYMELFGRDTEMNLLDHSSTLSTPSGWRQYIPWFICAGCHVYFLSGACKSSYSFAYCVLSDDKFLIFVCTGPV